MENNNVTRGLPTIVVLTNYKNGDDIRQCAKDPGQEGSRLQELCVFSYSHLWLDSWEGYFSNRIWEILTFWCLLCSTLKAIEEDLPKKGWESVFLLINVSKLSILIKDT